MTNKTWELYDPITVLPDGGMPAMDGVIAYLDHPKKPTKLGIRLTGSSIGLGDHSGSVDGIDYFDCPLNSGVFCTPNQIEARTLSRIEQLRLKRELAAGQLDSSRGGGGSSVGGGALGVTAAPPRDPNYKAIPPQEQPKSISLNGLSPTALARLQQINPGYLDPNAPVSVSVTPTVPVPEEEEENLDSDSSSSEEEYLKENRKHIGRLQQRKEEIRLRKLQLQQKKTDDDSDKPEAPTRTDHPASTTTPIPPVPAPAPVEEERPLSRLEQLKLKKRQLESTTATESTTSTATQPSTVDNIVSMAAQASPSRPASTSGGSEQVPWPFPSTTRQVSSNSSLTNSNSELGHNTTAVATSQSPAPEEPLSRLEQLKLKKRQLEEGGPPPPPKASSIPPPPPPPEEEEAKQPMNAPPVPPNSMDSGAPINGNNGQQQPVEVTVQIMNSSTKRVKELQVPISKDINLFVAVYDAKSVKQANVRKWGSSFVQQVKEQKSEIRCRVTLLSNPPPEKSVGEINVKAIDLSVEELKTISTEYLYNLYKDHFYSKRSKIQMFLVCQPVHPGDEVAPPPSPPKEEEKQVATPTTNRSNINSIAETLKDVKHQLRIKIINERTRYFKDLLVETSQQINLYEAIYNNPAVKEAKVRKWNSSIVDQVRSGMAEIVCQICTIPNGKPEHLVKHGILTIEQLKECSTTQLYTRYAMDHYDLDNDESLIQLVLKCQEILTPVASNQAKVQDKSKMVKPTRLSNSLPPDAPLESSSRGNPVLATPPVPSRSTHQRASPTDASQSSFTSMEKKPTNSPYAKAASAALPGHNTETKFSDLFGQQAQAPPASPAAAAQPVNPDPELGQAVVRPIATFPKADASVQTTVEITTPVRDNRQQATATQQQRVGPMTLTEKLQEVDAFWWLAIIFILAAAFFAALFLGPVS